MLAAPAGGEFLNPRAAGQPKNRTFLDVNSHPWSRKPAFQVRCLLAFTSVNQRSLQPAQKPLLR